MNWLTRTAVMVGLAMGQGGAYAAPVSTLPENRFLHFNDYTSTSAPNPVWVHEGPLPSGFGNAPKALLAGTNHYHRTGWRFISCRTGCAGYLTLGRTIPPLEPATAPGSPYVASNLAANLQNDLAAHIESPVLTNGVGTLYFEAINNLAAYPTELTVEIATNMVDVGTLQVVPTVLPESTNGLAYVWETLDIVALDAATANDFVRYNRLVDFRGPAKLRIRRSGSAYVGVVLDSAFSVVDNIRVSTPPTSVTIYDVGAYNVDGNYTLRGFVSHAAPSEPATARVVTGHYRWPELGPPTNAWASIGMTLVDPGDGQGNGERYEAVIPPQILGGDLEFYLVCAFDGEWYVSPDYTGSGYAGYPSEARSPVTTPTNTQHFAGLDFYNLTVTGGSGDGAYTNGQPVAIAADAVTGKAFDRWAGATQYVANVTAANTTVTMPTMDIEVVATYVDLFYTLAVTNGSGDGAYVYQQVVPIQADAPPANQIFLRWTGATQHVANVLATNTTVTMPAADIAVTATYIQSYALTVNGGSGGGDYTNGQQVAVAAAPPPLGKTFARWTGDTAHVANVYAPETIVTMPAANIAITATYVDVHSLTVFNGTGSGAFTNGHVAAISALVPPNKVFDRWVGDTQFVANATAPTTTVTMPAQDVVVTATFVDLYTLTVNGGTGGGNYREGEAVSIAAGAPAIGKVFDVWTGATQYLADASAPNTTLTMPAAAIAVTATYRDVQYTLNVANGTGDGAYTYGAIVPIAATIPGGRIFDRWAGDVQYVANVLNPSTTVTMPAANVSVVATFLSITTDLPEDRFLHFNDYTSTAGPDPVWVHVGPAPSGFGNAPKAILPGTNHYHRTGWRFTACRNGCAGYLTLGRTVPPVWPETAPSSPYVASNLAANLQNDLGAMIESPVFTNGIGTIYFEAINNLPDNPTEITLEISTSMRDSLTWTNVPTVLPPSTNGLEYVWDVVEVLTLSAPSQNDFLRYQKLLNFRGPALLRIRRTGVYYPTAPLDSAFTVIDNIRVSAPPTDVRVSKTEAAFEPGYLAAGTGLTVRCFIDNVDMNVPTDTRIPKVVYRWRYLDQVIPPWRTNTMAYVIGTGDGQGNGERYEAVLQPFSEEGDLEYFFLCEFTGYVYQSLDYTAQGYVYPSESLSPRFLRAEGGAPYKQRVRRYASQFGSLYVESDQHQDPIAMDLVGDREWRGMVPLAGRGITNLTWRFKAVNEYVTDSGVFATGVTYWAGVEGVAGGRVPYGGFCVESEEGDGRLSVLTDTGNYVALTLNTDTLQYLATRGEYQNFNAWPAPVNYFSESNGQDPKTQYLNTFDAWPTNSDTSFYEPIVAYVTTTNVFQREPFVTPQFWVAGSAAYVSERPIDSANAPPGLPNFRNLALRLKGGDGVLGLGYVHNTLTTLPDGLKNVRFKCRLGQAASNLDVAYHRYSFTNFNYGIKLNMQSLVSKLTPETPSISIIGYYQDADHFYEYRVTQIKDPEDTASTQTTQDNLTRHELYKWLNGTPTRLGAAVDVQSTKITTSSTAEMRIYNTGATQTRIKCKYGANDRLDITDSGGTVIKSGSFGVLSADCESAFSEIYIQPTDANANFVGVSSPMLVGSQFDTQAPNWFAPSGRFELLNGVTPKGIYAVRPSQQIGIYLQNTVYGSDEEPDAPGGLGWRLAKTLAVNGFGYQQVDETFNAWQAQYVMLQVMGGTADVAVDEMQVNSWHGKKNGLGDADVYEWVATESWVISNATGQAHVTQLDHSRADPAKDQAIRSLLLETGTGLMEFDYRVVRAPVRLKVQVAPKRDPNAWEDVETFTFGAVGGWTHASAYLGLPEPGYFRLLHAREGVYTNGFVEVNNAAVWDEPSLEPNSWRAYNAKISMTDTNRVYIDETAGCYLNNSTTLETSPIQDQFEPYLQSPELPKGLGRISFLARAYTNNQAATLYLYATTNGWGAQSNQWFEIHRWQNITNGLFRLYSFEPVDGRAYDAVKLGTKIGGSARRVCVEEVAISEPVFPGFDISNVRLRVRESDGSVGESSQPLEGDETDVEARLTNIQMTPSNIVMYMSYYVGTNVWGIGNWPVGEVVTRKMLPVDGDPTLYRTVPEGSPGMAPEYSGGIPSQDRDAVVQYYVWATYDGGIPLSERQETFENPSWYYPIDLNQTYASQGWSPYFFVYGVPNNAVWINEINATDYVFTNGAQVKGIWDNKYIEIAVPAWMDLAGWKVDLVTTAGYATKTITIPAGLPQQQPVTNGYAFFVIGDAAPPPPGVPALPKMDYGYPGLSSDIPQIMPGGLRLRRPQGMYEQTIAYDWNASFGSAFSGVLWATNDPQKRFGYIGREHNEGSLSRIGNADTTNDWVNGYQTWNWTPGLPNAGQTVPNGDSLVPGVSNVLVASWLNIDKGTQNGRHNPYYSLKLRKGSSTNMFYEADDWYRIYSVKKNEVEQLPANSELQTYNLPLPDLQEDVTVNVELGLREDVQEYEGDSTILNWILSFDDGELVPMYYNNRILTLEEQYWLDANPTVSNHFECIITKFEMDPGTNFHLTVRMALNGQKKSSLQGTAVLKLQAKSGLADPAWTMLAQYSLTPSSFDANNLCRVFVGNPFYFIMAGADPRDLFFRWAIEWQDPRVTVLPLQSEPIPD